MPRCIVTATISFGFVSVPIKVYTAAAPVKVDFNLLSPDGNRVRQQLVDTVTGKEVNKETCDRGFEHAKGQFLKFSQAELKKLESPSDWMIHIKEFVDADTLDIVAIDRTYYIGPDKGGDRSYALLADMLKRSNRVALAQWSTRGRDKLIVIRPYKNGLILHEMFYSNEVRSFEEVENTCAKVELLDLEKELADKLLSAYGAGSYNSSAYEDGYRKRVTEAVEARLQGQALEETKPEPIQPNIVDMLEALKRSVTAAEIARETAAKKTGTR